MEAFVRQGDADVVVAMDRRQARGARGREVWVAALAAGALAALLFGVARPFDARAQGDEPIPSILAD